MLFNKGEIYLHYNPEHIHRYNTSRENMIEKITNIKNIEKLVAKTFVKTDNLTDEEVEAYINFLGSFGKPGILQQAIQQNLDKINFTTLQDKVGNYDNFYAAFEAIKSLPEVTSYTTLLPQITKLNQQLLQGVQAVNWQIIDSYVSQAIAKGCFSAPPPSSKQEPTLGKQLEEIYNLNNQAIIYKPNTQVKGVNLTHFLVLQRLLERINTKKIPTNIVNNKMLQYFVSIFVNRYNSVMGFAYQTILSNFPDIVIDDIIVHFCETGGQNAKLKYVHKTGNKTISSVVKTQDFSIQAIINGQGETPTAKIISNFNLPGASVKFSSGRLSGSKNHNIRIKTQDVVLGHLLHDLDNNLLYWIYNILGSYNRSYKIGKQTYKSNVSKDDYINMWDALKKAVTINGLIGQMSQEDFSYYFIVANKVYTIPEILNMIVNGATDDDMKYTAGISGGQTMRLNPSQVKLREAVGKYEINDDATPETNAKKRSREALGQIMSSKIKAGISIKFTKI